MWRVSRRGIYAPTGNLGHTEASYQELATSFACPIAEQRWTACHTAAELGWADTCYDSCWHRQGWPWRSSVRSSCCPDLAFEVAAFDSAAAVEVAGAVAAAGRTATSDGIVIREMAAAEAFATSDSKGSRRMMGFDGAAAVAAAADQDPCSLMASLDAWVQMALTVVAWQILEKPSGSADWGKPGMIGASSEC